MDGISIVKSDNHRWSIRKGLPSDKQISHYLDSRALPPAVPSVEVVSEERDDEYVDGFWTIPGKGVRPKYRGTFLIDSLRVARRLTDVRYMEENVYDGIRLAHPRTYKEMHMQLKDKNFKSASRFTITRSRYRSDAGMMMLRRHYNNHPGLRRQLFFDASPQKGVEIFMHAEKSSIPATRGRHRIGDSH